MLNLDVDIIDGDNILVAVRKGMFAYSYIDCAHKVDRAMKLLAKESDEKRTARKDMPHEDKISHMPG